MVITILERRLAAMKKSQVEFMVAVGKAGVKAQFAELLRMSNEVDRRREAVRQEAAQWGQLPAVTESEILRTEYAARKSANEKILQLRYPTRLGE